MFNYIRSRIQRGYSLLAMGPNEARILYDLTVTAFSAGGSFFFCRLFVDGERSIWQALIFPLGVVAGNTALGLYSRFRTASGRRKAVCLAISVGLVSFLEWSLLADAAFVLLSALLALPLLITARLLLNLPYTRHKGLVVKAARQRGPVLVIGGAGYIGTHVVEQLLADGQAVRVLDRLMYGRQPLTDFIGQRNFELIEGDATDISRLTYAMQGASRIDDWQKPSRSLEVTRYVLSAVKPAVLYIPAGFANGFMSLNAETRLLFFSTAALEESKNDDFRFDARYWNIWDIVER